MVEDQKTKTCKLCKRELALDKFYLYKWLGRNGKPGSTRDCTCKQCVCTKHKNNRAHINAVFRKRYLTLPKGHPKRPSGPGPLRKKKTKEELLETKRRHARLYHYRKKASGKITAKIMQMVYEDNIKKYGTLTCVYCFNSILFGNDSIDHKLALTKDGDNSYDNLCIACRSCNSSKGTKTIEEFMLYRKEKYHGV